MVGREVGRHAEQIGPPVTDRRRRLEPAELEIEIVSDVGGEPGGTEPLAEKPQQVRLVLQIGLQQDRVPHTPSAPSFRRARRTFADGPILSP